MKKIIRSIVEFILTVCARLLLWRHRPIIIAITGSAGKTTTKIIIGSALKGAVGGPRVLVTHGNLGSVSGLPLALLSINVNILDVPFKLGGLFLLFLVPVAILRTIWLIVWPLYPKYVVAELTADRPGDFNLICQYLKPTVSVVTNIGPAHLHYFKTLAGIAKEKATIVRNTKADGLVVLNKRDELVTGMASLTKARVQLIDTEALNFAKEAALRIGDWLGLPLDKIRNGLDNAVSPKGRFSVVNGRKDTVIIDSTYNANPVSVKFELERLSSLAQARKIAVLGDMLELGPESERYHKEVGETARQVCDYLVAVGPMSKVMPADYWTQSASEASDYLLNIIKPGDTILVKASHGMHLESIVNRLRI